MGSRTILARISRRKTWPRTRAWGKELWRLNLARRPGWAADRFAHSAGPFYLGCLRGGRLCCCLCVCLYVRSIVGTSCAHFGNLSWGPLGLHFGSSGGSLGHHFGVPGPLSGSILGVWGLPWASFLGLWGSSCAFGALWGPPLAAQGGQSQIFRLFSLPFWTHFGSILEVKIDEKSDVIFNRFLY